MNVLELCLSDGRGGLEFYVADTAAYLAQNDIPCHCVLAPHTPLQQLFETRGLAHSTLRRRWRDGPLLAALQLARHIRRHDIDILHINWGHDLPLAVLAKRLSARPVKLVYSRHMRWVKAKRDIYHRWLYRHVDLLLPITEQLRRQALEFLPVAAHRVQVCYLGRPPCPPLDEGRCKALLEGLRGEFVVGVIGRIEHKKGQHVLIDALTRLNEKGLAVGAIVIGHAMDQAYLDELKQRVNERGLQQRVRFRDFVDRPMAILPCFDALVLTTDEETFGLVLVEAMQCGVAVIGTRAGGVLEIIDEGQTGLLFEPGDAAELASCIESYYEDTKQRQAIAERGRNKAVNVFSTEQHYRCFIDALNTVYE